MLLPPRFKLNGEEGSCQGTGDGHNLRQDTARASVLVAFRAIRRGGLFLVAGRVAGLDGALTVPTVIRVRQVSSSFDDGNFGCPYQWSP